MKRYVLAWSIGLAAFSPALAQSYYLNLPVTRDAGAPPVGLRSWDVARNDTGAYSLEFSTTADSVVDALHRMDGGDWLLSVSTATNLGGTVYDRRDVVRFDGTTYTLWLDGAAAGIPDGSDVDAVFLDGGDGGPTVVSFDVTTEIGGTLYEPADLVTVLGGGAFAIFFDASNDVTPGIPDSRNLTGAAPQGSGLILTFDTPVTSGATYLPGEVVRFDGAVLSPQYAEPSWPQGARANSLAQLASAGLPQTTIFVDRLGAGDLDISWYPTCSGGGEDYGIYEGTIGSWYSHTLIDCSDDGGDFTEVVTPAAGNRYYLVVAHHTTAEGSYGQNSTPAERPMGVFSCMAAQKFGCP